MRHRLGALPQPFTTWPPFHVTTTHPSPQAEPPLFSLVTVALNQTVSLMTDSRRKLKPRTVSCFRRRPLVHVWQPAASRLLRNQQMAYRTKMAIDGVSPIISKTSTWWLLPQFLHRHWFRHLQVYQCLRVFHVLPPKLYPNTLRCMLSSAPDSFMVSVYDASRARRQ